LSSLRGSRAWRWCASKRPATPTEDTTAARPKICPLSVTRPENPPRRLRPRIPPPHQPTFCSGRRARCDPPKRKDRRGASAATARSTPCDVRCCQLQGSAGVSITALADYSEDTGPCDRRHRQARRGRLRAAKAANPKDGRGVLVKLTRRRKKLAGLRVYCGRSRPGFGGLGRERKYRAVASFKAKFIRTTRRRPGLDRPAPGGPGRRARRALRRDLPMLRTCRSI